MHTYKTICTYLGGEMKESGRGKSVTIMQPICNLVHAWTTHALVYADRYAHKQLHTTMHANNTQTTQHNAVEHAPHTMKIPCLIHGFFRRFLAKSETADRLADPQKQKHKAMSRREKERIRMKLAHVVLSKSRLRSMQGTFILACWCNPHRRNMCVTSPCCRDLHLQPQQI